MYVNDLADLARGAGLSVTETSGWKNRNHGALSSVTGIVIHHTAGAKTGDYPSLGVVTNGRGGPNPLAGPLCNVGVGRSGRIYTVSNGLAYHAGAVRQSWMSNAHMLGFECESVGTGPAWPAAQVNAAAKLAAALCKKYKIPVSKVLGHNEVCAPVGRKTDPVGIPGGMNAFRAKVQGYINNSEEMVMDADVKAAFVNTQERINKANDELANVKALVNSVREDLKAVKVKTDAYLDSKNSEDLNEDRKQNVALVQLNAKLDAILAKLA